VRIALYKKKGDRRIATSRNTFSGTAGKAVGEITMPIARHQLWNLSTGNCLGAYAEEAAALADVRAGVSADGADGMEAWLSVGLLKDGILPGNAERIASGSELIGRALSVPDGRDTEKGEQ
jgi:hypothetical protein